MIDIALALILHPKLPKVLIARRRKNVHLASLWEFPGGKIEASETPQTAVLREVLEETGLTAGIMDLWEPVVYEYPERMVALHPVVCLALNDSAAAVESDAVAWVTSEELSTYPMPQANEPIIEELTLLLDARMRFAESETDIRRCFAAISVLRPHLTEEVYIAQVQRQLHAGYRMAYLEDEGYPATVAGFRLVEHLSRGRNLYIDDLVSSPDSRGKGLGGSLLDQIIVFAKANGCDTVDLDSGYQRNDAHRLYLNHGFTLTSHHFSMKISR